MSTTISLGTLGDTSAPVVDRARDFHYAREGVPILVQGPAWIGLSPSEREATDDLVKLYEGREMVIPAGEVQEWLLVDAGSPHRHSEWRRLN